MAERDSVCVAVVMAGGSGTRFWPLSTREYPKQFLSLFNQNSLLQETIQRLAPLIPLSHVYICSSETQKKLLQEQVPAVRKLILEPEAKNTAACLMLSTLQLLHDGWDPRTVMAVLPADHYIENSENFRETLARAIHFARESQALVTLGVVPTSPHTGYGYIEASAAATSEFEPIKVKCFIEKPDRETAVTLIKNPRNYWNSGMFLWTIGALTKAFENHVPEVWAIFKNCPEAFENSAALASLYQNIPALSIDVAVLEKANNIFVIPANFAWSDVGSWDALYQLRSHSVDQDVVLSGHVKTLDSSGCLVKVPEGLNVALVGVENLIVVQHGNTLLIADRTHDQKVREISKCFE
jgi:mannose-1-phosphate guanylyltransferase